MAKKSKDEVSAEVISMMLGDGFLFEVMDEVLNAAVALEQTEGDEPPGEEDLPLLMTAAEGTIRLVDTSLAAVQVVLAQIADARQHLHNQLVARDPAGIAAAIINLTDMIEGLGLVASPPLPSPRRRKKVVRKTGARTRSSKT